MLVNKFPLKNPEPDFNLLREIIKGNKEPERVHFVEFLVDEEVIQHITEKYFDKKCVPDTFENREEHLQQVIDFYYKLGYDYVPLAPQWFNIPDFKKRITEDTAELSKGKRNWVEEGEGIIKEWHDFENIDWETIEPDYWQLEYTQEHLPHGMKMTVYNTVFQMVLENLLGYEDLFIYSYDKPELVEAIFDAWGKVVLRFYEGAVKFPQLGAIFHADDMGYKTGTMLNPQFLKKNVLKWLKKYAGLAHSENKMFWLHSCGNLASIMDDLINYVNIDAYHSFQDIIIPVAEYVKEHNHEVATLGGVDMDKLVRLKEEELRIYVRDILKECMPERFLLGSGNTIANYVPPENYLIMLEEGLNWKKS